jgi:periplasmic protein TonB
MFGSKLDIFKKEWTDVIFRGRNKEYGAYELRQQNAKSTNLALIIGSAVFVFILSINTIVNAIEGFIPKAPEVVKLTDVKLLPPPPVDQTKKPPPPPPEPPKPKVDQIKFPPPIVRPDNEAKEPPPTVAELKTADPGPTTQKGDPSQDVNIDGPVGNSDAKVTEADPNAVFAAVEQEPVFKNGGAAGFNAYLSKAVKFPAVDRENGTSGKVIVTFVVERDGSLTDVKALRGPDQSMMDAAVAAIKSSPAWKPGVQNGQKVRVQFTIQFAFSLADADQ